MRRRADDAWGDAVYGAWRSGLNPDDVDRERVAEDIRDGYDRHEAAEREVHRLRNRQKLRALAEKEGSS